MSEKQSQPFHPSFNSSLTIDVQRSRVSSDDGLILVRELDDRPGFGELVEQRHNPTFQPIRTQPVKGRLNIGYSRPIGESEPYKSIAMKIIILAFLLFAVVYPTGPARAEEFDHAPWERVLKKYVTEAGRVDYSALKKDRAELDRYVDAIAARSPVSHTADFPTRESQLAYWINTYNALVIHSVVEAWPVKSVRKIGILPYSFFWRKKFVAGGRKYTLNGMEAILRKRLAEPRVHFVLVCAAISCPRLEREAFVAENVEMLLEKNAHIFVNDPRNLQIDAASNLVTVARIYTFYEGDFEAHVRAENAVSSGHPIVDYIRLYATDSNRQALDALKEPCVVDFDYDWGINDVGAPPATLAAKEV